jgi:hypothetical protein
MIRARTTTLAQSIYLNSDGPNPFPFHFGIIFCERHGASMARSISELQCKKTFCNKIFYYETLVWQF